MFMKTHSSVAPETKTVELLGFCLTVATARSNEAFLSFKSFVCCASRRSWGIGKQSMLKVGKREQARHARTLFDDGRKRGLLCIALCKAQSEKFLPRRFCHESKSEIVWNPRLLWARAEYGPDARRWARPAGRQLAGVAPKEAKRREGEPCTTLTTATHGSRPSQGTFPPSFLFFSSP